MSPSDDPWELPSARAFIAEIEGMVMTGGAIVTGGPSLPPGLEAAIARNFRDQGFVVESVDPVPGTQPATALAMIFGGQPEAGALARETGLADHLAIVPTHSAYPEAERAWGLFFSRFLMARTAQDRGLAILCLASGPSVGMDGLPLVAWNGRLRRVDVTIWADLHAPLDRPEPLATLASALAVDLCGWRLDLAAEIAQARRKHLLNPLDWLALRTNQGAAHPCRLNGLDMSCPLALWEAGAHEELRHRIWRAQLAALFPWIEAHHQGVVARHRKLLLLDANSRDRGMKDVDDIEFGALAWQLRGRIERPEAELIDCFARLRNDLAHRKPTNPEDLNHALREVHRV